MKKVILILGMVVVSLVSYAQNIDFKAYKMMVEDLSTDEVSSYTPEPYTIRIDLENDCVLMGNQNGSAYALIEEIYTLKEDGEYRSSGKYWAIDEEKITCQILIVLSTNPKYPKPRIAVIAIYNNMTIAWYGELIDGNDERKLNKIEI